MKKKNLVLMRAILFGLFLPFVFSSCDDDDSKYGDVDGGNPIIDLVTGTERTEVKTEFRILGTITDRDGLRSIQLVNKDIYLDKTIDLLAIYDELQYVYELDYKFSAVNEEWEDEHFDIKVIATDVGNRSTEETFRLSLDGDVTPPVFTTVPSANITVLIKEETTLNLKFSASDNKGIDYAEYAIPAIGIEGQVDANGAKTIDFGRRISLPATNAEYDLSIKVVDRFGLEVSQECKISVSELPDFEKMYLADVKTAAELNAAVLGVPILIDRIDPFTYRARYYTKEANTEIRFIPQKTDFDPICFGIDPDNTSTLTDDPDAAEPIVLPEANKYYEIIFNTQTGEYSYATYTPTDTPVEVGKEIYLDEGRPEEGTIPLEITLIGGIDGGEWSPSNPLLSLTQDTTNPFLLTGRIQMNAGSTVRFIIGPFHSWGWWPDPFWRWEDGETAEANVYLGGDNPRDAGFEAKQTGEHIFEFDTHLLRSKLYPAN